MNDKKRAFLHKLLLLGSVILVAVAVMLIVPTMYDNNFATFSYVELDDGTIMIESYSEYPYDLTIPDEIDGKKVSAIKNNAFASLETLESVTFETTALTTIGDGAFYGCTSLKEVVLSEGIVSLGKEVFSGCSSLKKIELPDSVVYIGDYAFNGCLRLSSLQIPASCTYIGEFAFNCCENLILDCSQNDYAAKYAESNHISVGFEGSMKEFYLKVALCVAIPVVMIIAVMVIMRVVKKRKVSANQN